MSCLADLEIAYENGMTLPNLAVRQCLCCNRPRGTAHMLQNQASRRRSDIAVLIALIVATVPDAVCASQSALAPASPQSEGIARLWWAMFYGSVLIFLAVMAILALGLWRARRANPHRLSKMASRNLVLCAGVAIPLVILSALVGGSLVLGRSLDSQPPSNALTIKVTGWMWWWEIEYLDDQERVIATTANEMHVPVGRPVEVLLTSGDVIHSFWVPQLQGKTDMVPGVINQSWFTADSAGVFRGQCAEFCGKQHALMAFLVVAQPEQKFERWLAHQQQPANAPASEQARYGQRVFQKACASCHRVRGTRANGGRGPDLTHFASRQTLAAATRANDTGHLGGWIADPQSIKPGNAMPATRLNAADFNALMTYLEGLK